jgi:hypothetical protein
MACLWVMRWWYERGTDTALIRREREGLRGRGGTQSAGSASGTASLSPATRSSAPSSRAICVLTYQFRATYLL